MINKPNVERVLGFDGIGHCPHDEAPELVNPFLLEFLNELESRNRNDKKKEKNALLSIFGGNF